MDARRPERRNRNVQGVHEDFEHRATPQTPYAAIFKTASQVKISEKYVIHCIAILLGHCRNCYPIDMKFKTPQGE
jgi:hypothetical protein